MAKDIHKGILLDDQFRTVVSAIQKNIDKLYHIQQQFVEQEHTSVPTQTDSLTSVKGSLQDLVTNFMKLRSK